MATDVAYCLLTENEEPSNYQETIDNSDSSLWMVAMKEVIEALYKKQTWKLVSLPLRRKAIRNKLVYKIKRDNNDQVERYCARLMVKGYVKKESVNFKEIFSPIV